MVQRMNISDKTIITGTDKKYQHYLPWWMHNVKKYFPGINITICDFGMSYDWSYWAENVSDEFIKYEKKHDISWFFKPQTLIDSKYKYKCWIDIDCEVVGDISDIFEYVKPNKLSTAPDNYHSWGCKFQTGVFATEDKPDILIEWAEACKEPKNRGDQEILWDIVKKKQDLISLIPEEYNWLRIALARGNDISDKRIIHWTGPAGKTKIAELIKEYDARRV